MTEYVPVFPRKEDPLFVEKLAMLEDFGIFQMDTLDQIPSKEAFEKKAAALCQFEKTYYQHLVSQYISQRSPYRSILLYHGLGSGKTCSAITIAETFLTEQRLYDEPIVWVVSKKALKKSFEQEVFRTLLLTTPEFLREQCTGDTYYQMIPDHQNLSEEKLVQRVQKIIRSRYRFFGYEKFANTVEQYIADGTLKEKLKNKVIIVDEAHNIRNLETSAKQQKNIIEPFIKFIQLSEQNRLVFLSATPMFNESEEILWLMSLLMLHDKQHHALNPFKIPSFYTAANKPIVSTFTLVKQLASHYISYIRGNNPFTFAVRIRPKLLNISVLTKVPKRTFQGETIPTSELSWLEYIKDGIVPSVLSGIQLQNLEGLQTQKEKLVIAKLRQLNNITYEKQLTKDTLEYVEGKSGIYSLFKKRAEGAEGVSQFEYIKPEEPILNPAFGKLAEYATKFQTIYQLLKKSRGVVVIYSNFVWGGVVPLAIMLEHMGLSRYGENDLLYMQKKTTEKISFYEVDKPSYCILSGENEKDIMGSSKIDDLLEVINDSVKNKGGKTIKVVIMSPVASEGLTFKNVREMHVLDPWYHLNTTEQAIGRAIRHCSHSSLPIEERNVSIFLHATVFPNNDRETADLHAYRVSAMKYYQIENVDRAIKENALDCSLMKNVNYFPKDLFAFQTFLKTSHGTEIPYHYGDNTSAEIKCAHMEEVSRDTRAFREESYHSFIPTMQQKLRKYLKEKYFQEHIQEFTYEELQSVLHKNKEVAHKTLEESLYPYKLWDEYSLIYHYNKFIITNFKKDVLRPTRIQIESKKEVIVEQKESGCQLEKLFETFALESEEIAALKLYQSLDSDCWKSFAEKLILTPGQISKKVHPILAILDKQGSFIRSSELSLQAPGAYVGYVNLFSAEDSFEGTVWDEEEKNFRELLPSELERIKKQRKYVPFTDPSKIKIIDTIAMVQRYKNPKEPNSPYRFQFKLGLNNEKVKRSGIVCDSGLKKPEIEQELGRFISLIDPSGNKRKMNVSQMCFQLMYELYRVNRMWIPSSYKPK